MVASLVPGDLARTVITGPIPFKFPGNPGSNVPSSLAHGWIRVLRAGGKPRPRHVYKLPGFGTQLNFTSFTDTLTNAITALLERVYFHEVRGVFEPPALPDKKLFFGRMEAFRKRLFGILHASAPVSVLDYPATAYGGSKLLLYKRAAEKLVATGMRRSYSYLQTFLKHEKLIWDGIKRVVPRVISPRNPIYNVEVGRRLRHVEHVIYQAIATIFGRPTVMKGYNAFQVGRMLHSYWSQYKRPCAIGLDATRFDQHVSRIALKWEHTVYHHLYPGDFEFRKLLRWQLDNNGFLHCSDGDVRYYVEGGRCSGDMNTALGNCLLMCGMVHSWLREHGLENRVTLINNGDDCVLIGEETDLLPVIDTLIPWFAEMGFLMKVEPPVFVLEQVSFCQTQPVYDGYEYRMVRNPLQSLSKDATVLTHDQVTRDLRYQCNALGNCGLALTWGIPLLQSYYCALLRGNEGYADRSRVDRRFYDSGFYRLSAGLQGHRSEVRPEARISFARAFGIMPDVQVALESYYDSMAPLEVVEPQEVASFVTVC